MKKNVYVENAVRVSLTNLIRTSNASEWLPNWKPYAPKKMKGVDFNLEDFGQRGKKIPLIALPKKDLIHWIKVSQQSILLTVVPVSKVDFVREFISTKNSST